MDEIDRVREVYAGYHDDGRAERWQGDRAIHVERADLVAATLRSAWPDGRTRDLDVLDLGCGRGDARDELVSAGIEPARIVGVDVLPDRLGEARDRGLPVALASGAALPLADRSVDLVVAFTVLSSVRDPDVLAGIEAEVRRVLRPGGVLLVYDMRLPSPGNRTVRPLTGRRLDALFPGWTRRTRSCTLLPPLARRVAPEPGGRYDLLSAAPPLRSHALTVLRPPDAAAGMGLPPLPADPSVSVVMPIRNEGAFIEESLGAVLAQVDVDPPEVVVVDGHSDDGTPDRVRQVAEAHGATVTVLDNPQRIVPVSMNLALAEVTGDVVVRVDGHCVIAPDYLRRCLDSLAATGVECVGGPMETVGETPDARAIAAAQSSRVGVGGVAFRTSTRAAFVDTLAFGAYRREVFDRIGLFDEELVRNQDDELNLRLTRAGGRIWMDPSVRSTYYSRGTIKGLWRQYHGYGFYKVRVMQKHRTVPSPRHLVPAAFVAGVAGAVGLAVVRRSPWPAAAVLAPYAAVVGAASRATARQAGASTPTVALATATMHTAYGLGWWAGAARALRRRS
jgi:SAM-dependent methyltransferase